MANYHVNYLTGSDSTGDGSTGTPWQTISHALTTSSATTGDLIKVVGSTTTDVDTAASFATLERTNQITTGSDLTGSLSVGDIIIISPNITDGVEFNGWMHTEVEAITATTLTTRGYHIYPNQTGLTVTITKVNDVIDSYTTQENITADFSGAVVECGYDATFTSIIGYTYWVNGGVSVGGRSGTKFDMNVSGASIGNWDGLSPLFRNLAFCKYEYGIKVQFGQYAYATNIILLNAKAGAGDQGFYAGPLADGSTPLYINDCDGAPMDKNYMVYSVQGDEAISNMAPQKLYINVNRDRKMERGGGIAKGLVGYSQNGNDFGAATLLNQSYNYNISGDIVIMGIDSADYGSATYYKTPTIMSGVGQVVADTLKVVRNGKAASDTPICFILNSSDNAVNGNSYVKLPSGDSIKDADFATVAVANQQATLSNAGQTFEDTDGLWTSDNGTIFSKQNLVDQETGNSCLELVQTKGISYAGFVSGCTIAAFPAGNAGQRLTGVTFRYKKISGQASGFQVTTPIGGSYNQSLGNVNFASTLYSDSTVTNSARSMAWINACDSDFLIQLRLADSDSADTFHGLIDSITPIYS